MAALDAAGTTVRFALAATVVDGVPGTRFAAKATPPASNVAAETTIFIKNAPKNTTEVDVVAAPALCGHDLDYAKKGTSDLSERRRLQVNDGLIIMEAASTRFQEEPRRGWFKHMSQSDLAENNQKEDFAEASFTIAGAMSLRRYASSWVVSVEQDLQLMVA